MKKNKITLMEELKDLLEEDERLVSDGKLLKNRIVELALKVDKDLIKLLLSNERIKKHFFTDADGVLIFDKEKFMKFIDNKEFLPDSYTAFKNKIGLANEEGKYLAKSKEAVLVWPYKDCVLEGGQEEPDEKRKEIFHNVILVPDEIDRLLEPKVFTNFKRIDKDGEHPLEGFRRDPEINRKRGLPEDTITDNLIIKGNNLLVLHSLLKEFREKINVIYIDPPYNTGDDEFQYNDSFNHSTWLTFIKNRLEVAKDLLNEEGVIIVSCDDNEQAYLKVLMDEIFGMDNFLLTGVVKRPSEIATNFIVSKHEYFMIYTKDITKFKLKGKERYTISRGTVGNENQTMPVITFPAGLRCVGVKDGIYKETRKIPNSRENIENLDPIIVKDGKLVKPVRMRARWRSSRDMRKFFENDCKPTPAKINGIIEEIYLEGDRFMPQIKKRIVEKIPSLILENYRGSRDLEDLGLAESFKWPKSVGYIKQLISYVAGPFDIILDFFAGSGTTAHAVLDLNKEDEGSRQFILCEQLDYVDTVTKLRVKKVIEKIGDGDFVYMELMKLNEAFVERIRDAETTEELLNIWEDMKHNGFLSYRVDPRLFDENIEEFRTLSLDEQKRLLLEMLDYNDLYVNYSEIDDAIYNVGEEDKKLNKEFYEGE